LVSDAVIGIIVQMGMVVLLCMGFTFTYMIESFPNFAHIGFTLIGTTITFTMTKLMGINPYLSWPVSMILCGLLGVALYILIVNPIKRRRKDGNITVTLAFYALSIIIETVVGVYSFWIVTSRHETTRGFMLKKFDFTLFDLPGVSIMTPLASLCLLVILYVFLSRSKYGLAIRAVSENEDLSAVFGINTGRIHMVSWFIVGALAGLAGSIIPLWTSLRGSFGGEMLVTVMAGSIIGGLDSIYGAVIGGVLITLFQKGLTFAVMGIKTQGRPLLIDFSIIILGFSKLIPIILIVVILMLMPEGISGYIKSKKWVRRRA
jgi:branched-chain amino acid transport system permease protein